MPARVFHGQPHKIGVFAALNSIALFGRQSGSVARGPAGNTPVYSRSQAFNTAMGKRVGPGSLTGSVKIKGTPDAPVVRPVAIFDSASRTLLASAFSLPDGSYTFSGLPAAPVFVVSFDPTGQYRAVIADNLTPETF